MKMIIKNCPAFNDTPNMYDEVYGYCDNEHCIDLNKCMCENINDCVMKQIVELCKNNQKLKWQVGEKPEQWISFNNPSSYQILQLLDIQEAE